MITVTDQFCGAGGSSLGAQAAGLEIRMALNHWSLAIETHNTNFPNTDHDCVDISACDPRRYPSTDILITSPECTTHSPAGGRKRSTPQRDFFTPRHADPSVERSRATMWDVVRFTEYHRYQIVLTENVVEARYWELFDEWLHAMTKLGYLHKTVYLNSMHAHPTPQSRDRMYVVFWKKGNRAPDLDYRALAHCPRCEKNVDAVQAWKNGRTFGRYRRQYVYACPACATAVEPYYYAALNAIDWTLPADRIGDRKRPLKPRTMERIQYGLEKFGRRPLMVRTNMTSGVGCRVRDAMDSPMDTQPASAITGFVTPVGGNKGEPVPVGDPMPTQMTRERLGFVSPFIVNGQMSRRVHAVTDPLPTQQASREHDAVVLAPFVVDTARPDEPSIRTKELDQPLPAQTTQHSQALVQPFMVTMRGTKEGQRSSWAGPIEDPLSTLTAGGRHHGLIQGAALVTLRDMSPPQKLVRELTDPIGTQVASCTQDWIIQRSPYLISYYGTNNVSGIDGPQPTVTVVDRNALIVPEPPSVEDCYFRMLQPHEIGAAMAFPESYQVLGNKRDKVKQYGNAVTPPAMRWLIQQCVASLAPEVAA